MKPKIEKVAVIGAGIMGSAIGAHLLNSGIKVVLFDIVPPKLSEEDIKNNLTEDSYEFRNKFVLKGKEYICNKKNGLLYDPAFEYLLDTGNLDDDLEKIKKCDLIIEVVLEEVKIKENLFKKIQPYICEDAIVATNTSGLSIHEISSLLKEDVKERFLGIHFFNPVRYMHLVELVPTEHTSKDIIGFLENFVTNKLGKGVVVAKDTPNFIANRIGVYAQCLTFKVAENYNFNFSQIDQITGPLLMRPKSASFRTVDLVGLDILCHTAQTCLDSLDKDSEDLSVFELPQYVKDMLENKQLGNKTKAGFYKRIKKDGKNVFLMWDYINKEYIPFSKDELDEVIEAKKGKSKEDKLKILIQGNEEANLFAWELIRDILLYSANCVGKITDDYKNIDKGMKWGYNWEMGPFEIWDTLGVDYVIERIKKDGKDIPQWVKSFIKENKTFYDANKKKFLYDQYPIIKKIEDIVCSVDLGDGIVCIEFISKSNNISIETLEFIRETIKDVEMSDLYKGIVIGNKGQNFSAGVNLNQIQQFINEEDYDKLNDFVLSFQSTSHAIKYSKVPVIAAIHAMTMGGGHELALHCHATISHTETYRGFAEVGVGIIPGGAGFLEMLKRTQQELGKYNFANLVERDRFVWEIIATAKFSKNAYDMKNLLFLKENDTIISNKESIIEIAKQEALSILKKGFRPNIPSKVRVTGESGFASLEYIAQAMYDGKFISEHDFEIAKAVARVVTGGNVPKGVYLNEEDILTLEREQLINLLKTPKTQQRIKYMLEKNKPLRN